MDSTLPIFRKPVNQTAECGVNVAIVKILLVANSVQESPSWGVERREDETITSRYEEGSAQWSMESLTDVASSLHDHDSPTVHSGGPQLFSERCRFPIWQQVK